MGSRFSASRLADASAAAGTAKTMLRLLAGSADPVTIISWWVWNDDTTAADKPIKVEILSETTTSAPTGTSVTPVDMTQIGSGTAGAAVLANCSAEGTPTVATVENHLVPAGGGLVIQYPLGREITVPVSKGFRIRVTTVSATANLTYGVEWEE